MRRRSWLWCVVTAGILSLGLTACGGDDEPSGGGGAGGGGGEGEGGSTSEVYQAPEIDRIEPDRGPEGTQVMIYGRCFGATTMANKVSFGKTPSSIYSIGEEGTVLETAVPTGAGTAPITVMSDYGEGFVSRNGPEFTVTDDKPLPVVTSITPKGVTQNRGPVTIGFSGSGFVKTSQVFWNDVPLEVKYGSYTTISAVVPNDRLGTQGSFDLRVVNDPPGGGQSEAAVFKVLPALNVVSATAVDDRNFNLSFDAPVDQRMARDHRYFRIGGQTASAAKPTGMTHVVRVTTRAPMVDGSSYSVIVSTSFRSMEGAEMDNVQTTVRYTAPPPEEGEGG